MSPALEKHFAESTAPKASASAAIQQASAPSLRIAITAKPYTSPNPSTPAAISPSPSPLRQRHPGILWYRHVNHGERWLSIPMPIRRNPHRRHPRRLHRLTLPRCIYYFELRTATSGHFCIRFHPTLSNQPLLRRPCACVIAEAPLPRSLTAWGRIGFRLFPRPRTSKPCTSNLSLAISRICSLGRAILLPRAPRLARTAKNSFAARLPGPASVTGKPAVSHPRVSRDRDRASPGTPAPKRAAVRSGRPRKRCRLPEQCGR